MTIPETEKRLIENEIIFRKFNLHKIEIEKWAEKDTSYNSTKVTNFICECSDRTCDSNVYMTVGEYVRTHENKKVCAVLKGHENPDVENIIEERELYNLVEKRRLPEDLITKHQV